MFKLMVVVVIAVLLVRYVPAVRVWIAAKLEWLADELIRTRRGSDPPCGTHFAWTTHETELVGTRVLPSRTPVGLFWLAGETFSLRNCSRRCLVGQDSVRVQGSLRVWRMQRMLRGS